MAINVIFPRATRGLPFVIHLRRRGWTSLLRTGRRRDERSVGRVRLGCVVHSAGGCSGSRPRAALSATAGPAAFHGAARRDSPPPGGCGLLPSIPVPDRGWICGHAMILAARVRARPEATRRSFLAHEQLALELPVCTFDDAAARRVGHLRRRRVWILARYAHACGAIRCHVFDRAASVPGFSSACGCGFVSSTGTRAETSACCIPPDPDPLPIHPPPAGVGFYGASLGTGGWVCTHAIHLRFAVRRLQRRRGIHSPEVGERARGRSAFHPTLHVAWGTSAAGGRGSRAGLGAHRWMANQPFRRQRRAATDPASRERSRLLGRRPMRSSWGPLAWPVRGFLRQARCALARFNRLPRRRPRVRQGGRLRVAGFNPRRSGSLRLGPTPAATRSVPLGSGTRRRRLGVCWTYSVTINHQNSLRGPRLAAPPAGVNRISAKPRQLRRGYGANLCAEFGSAQTRHRGGAKSARCDLSL